VSFLLLSLSLIVFYPQYSSAFFHSNQIDSIVDGNFGSSASSSLLYSNPGYLYGSNFGSMFGGNIGGLGGLGMNNGFGTMMPSFGYSTPSFGSGGVGGGGGMLDIVSGLLGGLDSLSSNQEGFGSDYNSDYRYESNYYYNNNFDYTLQPNNDNSLSSEEFDSSNYNSNSDFTYGNQYPSDLPLEDLRSFDSSMEGQQYAFQNDYDFSQIPSDDFSSNLFQ
jgi:hypothetical protein